MKKALFIVVAVLLLISVIFAVLYVVDHGRMNDNEPVIFSTWGKKYAPVEITSQEAVGIVKKNMSGRAVKTITNYDNPKIEGIVFNEDPAIKIFEKKRKAVGRAVYKITFNTFEDGLLGPIVCYVDKLNGKILGADYRE
ncbi:MAG: hypothetical protein IJB42_03235 [Oscillospiraceae bacterium]|nr:hypothetical protein [Oscillospiraceae bacterium]